ncbi:hypothetical protein ABW20_dc0107747 [Dactylellina cionopaga]|nr:hypothetical protein ABW20_dc0107747 [Dactylellina cionopaga]
MFNFNAFTSPKTAVSWRGVGTNKPFGLLLTTLLVSIATIVPTIIINITDANEPDNDYGEGTGWVVMLPGPAITFLWTAVCMVICRFGNFSPGLALSTYTVVSAGLVAEGIMTALFYEWHNIAWLPAIFMLVLAIDCAVVSGYAIGALRRRSQTTKNAALDLA